ncbi:transglycosylase SLT domain-containing protein [Pseudorhodoferax sp. LjRoot39]|uniref:transglycosylase SLT domain-containing protein n=1 Tax=Pseudorhodoferax sp. LjRoot39 TaxID=3342328 RepID=UPI003ECD70C8
MAGDTHVPADRRAVLRGAIALGAAALVGRAHADPALAWTIYPREQTRLLLPKAAASMLQTPTTSRPPAPRGTATPAQPPAAYVDAAHRHGIEPWLLYAVALQESQINFGRTAVPYPWSLCVRGRGERHLDAGQARSAMRRHLAAGITNVDCGPMQVNWGWHRDKLLTVEQALDPYANLDVGAAILASHWRTTGNWRTAIGLYHTGSMDTFERIERAARYAASVTRRLAAQGQRLDVIAREHADAGASRG